MTIAWSLGAMNNDKSFIAVTIDRDKSLYPKCVNMYQPWSPDVCGYWSVNRRLDEYEYSNGYNDSKILLKYVSSLPYAKKTIYGVDHPCVTLSSQGVNFAKKLMRLIRSTQAISPQILKNSDQDSLLHLRTKVLPQLRASIQKKIDHEKFQFDQQMHHEKMAEYYRPCKTYYERKNWYYFQKHVHKELYIKHTLGIIKKHKAARAPRAGTRSISTSEQSIAPLLANSQQA